MGFEDRIFKIDDKSELRYVLINADSNDYIHATYHLRQCPHLLVRSDERGLDQELILTFRMWWWVGGEGLEQD